MTQLFKTNSNSRTISQQFTCYCNNIVAVPAFSCATRIRYVTSAQRLTVHILYLTHVWNGTNRRFCRPNKVIYYKIHVIHICFTSHLYYHAIFKVSSAFLHITPILSCYSYSIISISSNHTYIMPYLKYHQHFFTSHLYYQAIVTVSSTFLHITPTLSCYS